MRIAVIGRNGQVATELARHCPPDCTMMCLARPDMDLAHPKAAADALRSVDVDVVINAAAYTAVDKAEAEEDLARAINAEAPAALARVAAERGIPFLQVSTDYVYDGSGEAPWQPDSPTGPLGAYGRTKLAGDLGVIAAGGPHAILRTSWVFSAHGGNFVKTMLRLGRAQAAKRSPGEGGERAKLTIVADQIGGPTPAADIASALLRMAEKMVTHPRSSSPKGDSATQRSSSPKGDSAIQRSSSPKGDSATQDSIYHLSGAPDTSWAGFAREIFRQARIDCAVEDIPTRAYPTPAQRPANSRLDCTGLTETFGISRPDWREGLGRVLQDLNAG